VFERSKFVKKNQPIRIPYGARVDKGQEVRPKTYKRNTEVGKKKGPPIFGVNLQVRIEKVK